MFDPNHYDITKIRLPVTGEEFSFFAGNPDALIIRLHYHIGMQFNIIKSLVQSCLKKKYKGPAIIITDMSLSCIYALLRLAGLPHDSGENFYAIPSRLKPHQIASLLQDIINGNPVLSPIIVHEFNFTPLRQTSLMSIIEGVPEKQQARNQNYPIKSVYNNRNMIIRQLTGGSQHSFRCGTFKLS